MTLLSNNTLPSISVIVPTRDQVGLLRQCIDSLLEKTDYPRSAIEILIVNNKSQQAETLNYLSELSSLSFIQVLDYNLPFNFSAMNNLAAKQAKHEMLCLLNNDIEVISPEWLSEMAHFLARDDVGCVGAKLYYPNNTIQHAGVVLGINGVAGHIYKHCPRDAEGYDKHLLTARYCSAVTAACLLVKKKTYLKAGGFDENLAVAYNDVDFCIKLGDLGYKHVWTPRAELYHHESVSRGTHKQRTWSQRRQFKKETAYMKKKWGARLRNDPAWHPSWPLSETWDGQHLTQETPAFVIVATYNGVNYIAKQLDSLLAQSCPCLIHVYDDGSTDGTVELIQSKYLQHENVELTLNKKRLGYVRNFEQGIKRAYELGAQYLALCDQDDIWHPQRIEKMATALLTANTETPTLVYGDLQMMDNNEQFTHSSYLHYRKYNSRADSSPRSLAVALGQNGVMGNTILMNRALTEQILPFPKHLHSHDYWISLIAQLNGKCILVSEPLVNYRIHSSNVSNSAQSLTDSTSKNLKETWRRLKQRDYRLPYKEDSREQALNYLLDLSNESSGNLTGEISAQKRSLITGFLHYLNFDRPRWYLAYWMVRHNFIKKGIGHKLRFIYRVLMTTRYTG